MVPMEDTKVLVEEIDQIATRYQEQAELDNLRKKDVKMEIYFDTYHVLPIIQGYWELLKNVLNEINIQVFKDDRTLVKSLVYFEYINDIKILLPHAAELKNQLDKTYLLPLENVDQRKIDAFLKGINLDNLENLKRVYQNSGLEKYVLSLSSHSEDIFKANYVLDELIWTRRYSYLFEKKGIIKYDDSKYNNIEILETRLFHNISKALSLSTPERQHKTINNLRDAMALCMFHQKIKNYKENGEVLPLMYVSGGVLSRLPSELKDEFKVEHRKLAKGVKINLLKDTEFFIIDAMFSAEKFADADDKVFFKMQKIKESLKVYSEIKETVPKHEINSLVTNWKQLRDNDFFEKIWLDGKGGSKKLSKNIIALLQYDALVQNEETFKKIIEREKEKIRIDIDTRTNDLLFLEDIWRQVETFNEVIQERLNDQLTQFYEQPDIFKDEGLTRFSPPSGYVETEIKSLWLGFLECYQNDDERKFQLLKVNLTKIIYDGFLKEKSKNHEKILVGLSILWVFHKYQLIIKLVERLNDDFGKYYQIPIIYLSSVNKQGYKSSRYIKIIQKYLLCIESKDWYIRNYQAWMGVGYVKFNFWRNFQNASRKALEGGLDNYLNESIVLFKNAFEYLIEIKDDDTESDEKILYRNVKYYYAVNNFVFYSLIAESQDIKEEWFSELVYQLTSIQDGDLYNQCRFSDTIAHYHFFMAKQAKSKESTLESLGNAERFSRESIKKSVFKDERFQSLLDRILHFKAKVEGVKFNP